ncbi:MAG: hypothetical protein QF898_06065 [SAR202 cluster bacterium]|nr:hypothetical protein [SAR202 cluster bacterium]MDP6514331.1 hypothetical protein [SAR202 cluster bacterium]MDP6715564.1 hypothetical protein [SAR202 cluster bacterium]
MKTNAAVDRRTLFKFTGAGGRDAVIGGRWSLPTGGMPGEWMPAVEGPPGRFGVGYRLATLAALPLCPGRELYVAEALGDTEFDGPMVVCRRTRLIRRLRGWDGSAAERISRSAASRVTERFSCNGQALGALPMAAQDILERDGSWEWMDSAKDDLRLCAGMIANAAERCAVEGREEAKTTERLEAAAYQKAMAEERGRQLAELLLAALASDAGGPPLTGVFGNHTNLLGSEQNGESEILYTSLDD